MRVVATDAGSAHDDGHDQADAVAEQRMRDILDLLVRIDAQARQRGGLERIELVRRAVLERIIRDEAIDDVLLLLADHLAEFERQRGRNRHRPRHGLIVVDHLGLSGVGQDAPDNIAGVVAAHAGNQGIEVGRLPAQRRFPETCQIEPHRHRQQRQQKGDQKTGQNAARAQLFRIRLVHGPAPIAAAVIPVLPNTGCFDEPMTVWSCRPSWPGNASGHGALKSAAADNT